jgi:hypothetical protein
VSRNPKWHFAQSRYSMSRNADAECRIADCHCANLLCGVVIFIVAALMSLYSGFIRGIDRLYRDSAYAGKIFIGLASDAEQDTERETERERQKRETKRERDRETERERERERERQTDRETERQRDRETERQRQTDRQTQREQEHSNPPLMNRN